jgi:flagellar motor switch protein FliM
VRSQDIGRGLDEPLYVCPLAADPGGSRAVLALDARAIAFLLEGSLGGDGSDPPKLNKKGLTAAQRAFIDRIVGGMVQGLSDALAKSAGLTLTKLPQLINEKTSGGVLVQLPLDFRDAQPKTEKKGDFSLDDFDEPSSDGDAAPEAEGASHGTVVIAVSKTALNAARAANQTKKTVRIDRRVAATMREVQVNVVAELGRLKLRLGELATLRVGDTLRLDVPVNGDIDVRVENKVLFRGQPTTLGSQLAIQVVGHQDSDAPPPEPEPAAEPPPPPPPPAPAPRPVTAFRKP